MALLRRLSSNFQTRIFLQARAPLSQQAATAAGTEKEGDGKAREPLVVASDAGTSGAVRVVRMNNPAKLNSWTEKMLAALTQNLEEARLDDNVKAVILTGTGRYYCAGVDLSATKMMLPHKLHPWIEKRNFDTFQYFVDYPKPLIVAMNGPAVGASVTTASLCNNIVAAESATLSTPFFKLGVPPEGCSSVHFPALMGEEAAQRMLGEEGWTPTAKEAKEAGLVGEVAKDGEAVEVAVRMAEGMIEAGDLGKRAGRLPADRSMLDKLTEANRRESRDLASAFLSEKFLNAQYERAASRNKSSVAQMFWTLKTTRPLWSLMLPADAR